MALLKKFSPYVVVTVAASCLITVIMHLWKVNLGIPFVNSGDALWTSMMVKGLKDNPWIFNNRFVGMPFGLQTYDWLSSDNLFYLIIKLMTFFSHSWAVVENGYFLLTFPLTAVITFGVFRQLKISTVVSICVALLFAFLPYHFMRNEAHLFLASYFIIPLSMLLVFWIGLGELTPFKFTGKKFLIQPLTMKTLFAIMICFLTACSGVYYAFFSCFFLAIASCITLLSKRTNRLGQIVTGIGMILVICFVLGLNLLPSIIYQHQHGQNLDIAQRLPAHAEVFGLKIAQLLLPTTNHRIPALAELKSNYNLKFPLVNENDDAALGLIGSIGFLFLLGWIVYAFYRQDTQSYRQVLLKLLSVLMVAAVLLGTIGGFGSLFAIYFSDMIRAYNRISIFIAFIALAGIALLLDFIFTQKIFSGRGRIMKWLVAGIVLGVGLLDQTTGIIIPPWQNITYEANAATFNNDEAFVKAIENNVPAGAMIFQLPYMPFPESPPVNTLGDYELFRGYLHSQTLRWSYGALRGRTGDLWQKNESVKSVQDLIQDVTAVGFAGIYINRHGYQDNGKSIEDQISSVLNVQPFVSDNKELVYYSLLPYAQHLHQTLTAEEYQTIVDNSLHPLLLDWDTNCPFLESNQVSNWRWCAKSGKLQINNLADAAIKLKISMAFATGATIPTSFIITDGHFKDVLNVGQAEIGYEKIISVPPGRTVINFSTTGPKIPSPSDPRELYFRVIKFSYSKVN